MFVSKNSNYDIFAQSFFNLTIFWPCLTKNDERMQSESSGRRRNDENFASSKLIFLIIFVTSYTLLMKLSF